MPTPQGQTRIQSSPTRRVQPDRQQGPNSGGKQEIEQELEKESIFKSANEIPDLSDNGKITKEIVDTMVEKIVVSRYGSIEIYLRKQ